VIPFKQYIAEQEWPPIGPGNAIGLDTNWQDGDSKITLQDVLDIADEPIEIDPNELKPLLIKTERDPARVQAADLEYPIVVTTQNGQYTSILDGQHRIVKASEYNRLNPNDKISIKTIILNLDTAPEKFLQMFATSNKARSIARRMQLAQRKAKAPEESQQMFETRLVKEGWLDKLQLALDVIGFEPTVGTVADASNAVISALRSAAAIVRRDGDTAKQHAIDAGISAISMIPFGDIAKIAKLRKFRKPAVKAARLAKDAGKGIQTRRRRQSAQQIASFGTAGITPATP